ncbi:MAG: serine--tRNA ligase [Rickettsiales bacterium]|nr:serine--tRNA ligase [Rickettsiales bacterium]
MHDIKIIRDNPVFFDEQMKKRKIEENVSDKIIKLDTEKRSVQGKIHELQHERKIIAKEIGQLRKNGQPADDKQERARAINDEISNFEKQLENDELTDYLSRLPNIPAEDIPVGNDEADNTEVRRWGAPRTFDFKPKQHFELGEDLGLMDFEQTAKISGSRFVTLHGSLAKMERALANMMLDINTTEYGFTEVSPPLLVRDNAMYGVGQLPKFSEDSFETTNNYRLIPTAEVPLTNLVAGKILSQDALPLRFTAYTPCFRSEAGAAGKDTRGMIRLHQFSKVEVVSITKQEDSESEHENLVSIAETILQKLDIPYRVVTLCTGDTGFSAKKTYDLEVWLPGQDCYREISSCSNFGDFQARRMKTRYKDENNNNVFAHTLNGSALAIGRTIVAILENYQQEDGSITIPEALRPYMNGKETL